MATRYYIGIAETDGDGWSLGFPAFPGAVTTGDTLAGDCSATGDQRQGGPDQCDEDEGLVARLDRLAERSHASRSVLLARGTRLVLASEAGE